MNSVKIIDAKDLDLVSDLLMLVVYDDLMSLEYLKSTNLNAYSLNEPVLIAGHCLTFNVGIILRKPNIIPKLRNKVLGRLLFIDPFELAKVSLLVYDAPTTYEEKLVNISTIGGKYVSSLGFSAYTFIGTPTYKKSEGKIDMDKVKKMLEAYKQFKAPYYRNKLIKTVL